MLQKCSIFKVAEVFFKEPSKKHCLKEISTESSLAHTSVKEHLTNLHKLDIIKKEVEKKGKRAFPTYFANFDSKEYKFYKKIYNLEKIKQSGLIKFLKDELMPDCIVLFGSFAKAEDIESSDIDLFVECKDKELDLKDFEKFFKRKIQLHFKERFKDYSDDLKTNIINGIVLDGYLEAY